MSMGDTTRLRSFVGPVWQQISFLWSGVEFSFYDPLPDSNEQPEQGLFPRTEARDPRSGSERGRYEHCW